MNHLKKYETFDFKKTLPVASVDTLTSYYYCDECEALWERVNQQDTKCKFCHCENIEELNADEWYGMVEDRLEDDEVEYLRKERKEKELKFIDLYSPYK